MSFRNDLLKWNSFSSIFQQLNLFYRSINGNFPFDCINKITKKKIYIDMKICKENQENWQKCWCFLALMGINMLVEISGRKSGDHYAIEQSKRKWPNATVTSAYSCCWKNASNANWVNASNMVLIDHLNCMFITNWQCWMFVFYSDRVISLIWPIWLSNDGVF